MSHASIFFCPHTFTTEKGRPQSNKVANPPTLEQAQDYASALQRVIAPLSIKGPSLPTGIAADLVVLHGPKAPISLMHIASLLGKLGKFSFLLTL